MEHLATRKRPDLHAAITQIAEREERKLVTVVRRALRLYCEKAHPDLLPLLEER